MRWPVETRLGGADPVHFLSKTLASLSLKDQLGTSSAKKKKEKNKGKTQILNFLAKFIQFIWRKFKLNVHKYYERSFHLVS